MVEQQTLRVENAMKKIVEDIDKDYLRKMQANMYRCAARCCDNTLDSPEMVHRCVENCSTGLAEAQSYVQNEFSTVQNRLQRCVLECNDEIKDKIGPSTTDAEKERLNKDFETCAIRCVDKHVELLPVMMKRMKEVLSQKQKNSSLYYPPS